MSQSKIPGRDNMTGSHWVDLVSSILGERWGKRRVSQEERERARMVPGPHLSKGHGVVASH